MLNVRTRVLEELMKTLVQESVSAVLNVIFSEILNLNFYATL